MRILSLLRTKVWAVNMAEGRKIRTELMFHPSGARELNRLGLKDGYDSFCRKHNFVSHGCFNSMKCWYIASVLKKEIGTKENVSLKLVVVWGTLLALCLRW